jgi:hypothetical protein
VKAQGHGRAVPLLEREHLDEQALRYLVWPQLRTVMLGGGPKQT